MIPTPLVHLYPATQRETTEPFPGMLAQQHCMGSGNGGITPAEAKPLSTSTVWLRCPEWWLTRQKHRSLLWVPSFLVSVFIPRHTLSGVEDREPPSSPRLGHSLGRMLTASRLTRGGTWTKPSTSHVDIPTASTCTGWPCSSWPYFQLWASLGQRLGKCLWVLL